MAAPVITNLTAVYPQNRTFKFPGEAAELFVEAIDPAAATIAVDVTVRFAAGGEQTQSISFYEGEGPLEYEATTQTAGRQVVQDPTNPAHFYIT